MQSLEKLCKIYRLIEEANLVSNFDALTNYWCCEDSFAEKGIYRRNR